MEALAFGLGVVWIATPGAGAAAGSLMRVRASDGARLSPWPIGGDPVGLAVGQRYVWVAAGPGDPNVPAASKDTVAQFDASNGALVHLYSVSSPRAIAARQDGALVAAGGVGSAPTTIFQLQDGNAESIAVVPGLLASNPGFSGPSLVVCGSGIYVATSTDGAVVNIYVTQVGGTGSSKVATIPASGIGTLACSDQTLYLAIKSPDQGGIFPMSLTDSVLGEPFGPRDVSDLAVVGGRLWLVDQGFERGAAGYVNVLDPAADVSLLTFQLPPGDSRLLAPQPDGVWLVAGNQLLDVLAS